MMPNNMIKVGVTGGAGSGKTTLCDFLKESGYPVIYADIISKDVLLKYKDISESIKLKLGEEFFDGETLNRKKLGNRIFSDSEYRKKLEDIIIPYMTKEAFIKFNQFEKKGEKICFLDAPTLFENDLHKKMNYTILIYIDDDIQLDRLIKRDKISKNQAKNMIESQMSQDEKIKLADFVIKNNSKISYAKESLNEIINKIQMDFREKMNDRY